MIDLWYLKRQRQEKHIEFFPPHQQVYKISDSTLKLGEIKFLYIMLHYGLFTWKGNCYCSFIDVFIAVATNIHNKVSLNIECFKNFLCFSSILFIIFGALLTIYNLTSVWIFSKLFSIHFLMCWREEFV